MPNLIPRPHAPSVQETGTVTEAWIATWRGHIQVENPPIRCSLAPALEYLCPFSKVVHIWDCLVRTSQWAH
jgi:hypothetical protein